MDNYLDEIHDSVGTIRMIANGLARLSKGFQIVGNDTVSDELMCMAVDAENAAEQISDAIVKDLNRRSAESREMCGKFFSLAVKTLTGHQATAPGGE